MRKMDIFVYVLDVFVDVFHKYRMPNTDAVA